MTPFETLLWLSKGKDGLLVLNALFVALGGAIGSVGRYLMGAWMQNLVGNPDFPWGTFLVNVTGSLLIGVAFGLSKEGVLGSPGWNLLAVGALGGFTTYSTFALESLELMADGGRVGAVLLNTIGQLLVGLALGYVGVLVVRGLQGMGGAV